VNAGMTALMMGCVLVILTNALLRVRRA
jgi:hypothetical protein